MPGIQIGDGAIIATKVSRYKDVRYTVVGGNPAQEIRKRFEESIIQELVLINGGIGISKKLPVTLKLSVQT